MIFQPILIVFLNKLVNVLKRMIRAVEMIIKWLVYFIFSINIADRLIFLVSELLQNRYPDSRLILLSRIDCGKGGRGTVNLRVWFPDVRYLEAALH